MKSVDVDRFDRERTCTYRRETYRVRDNGAVLRRARARARRRPLDEKWMYGRASNHNGYLWISSVQVHRIVARAFHGPQPSAKHVVDHIDTNRRNNRPENLRWVTRLENILQNPITARRVELAYGSIENFLANPSTPIPGKLDPEFDWMRSVSKEEAEQSYVRLTAWAKSDAKPTGGKLGEWLYMPRSITGLPTPEQAELSGSKEQEPDEFSESKTLGAVQRNWVTPSEFPHCPTENGEGALAQYRQRLNKGEVFSRNVYGESKVVISEFSVNSEVLVVLSKSTDAVKEWALAQISVEDERFVHENLGSFFTREGAMKRFTLARGLLWEGGDSIDDYC